ncbi:hypothetical protein ASG91_06310 [Phycicoccus sp. Soil802]|nr:hypothetical protein ASG91_06310 [Phycicoccus sp. Soil802]
MSVQDLESLKRAVEWASFLNADSTGSDLMDPCCMLEALSDVYAAAYHMVHETTQWGANLASDSAP